MSANTELLENIAKHLAGESTPTLEISFCALSTSYDIPDKNSTLALELGRVAVDAPVRSGSVITVASSFGASDAICLNTTISGVTSTTVFTVTSATGLQIGDRVQITLSNLSNRKEERKISNIAGSTITLSEALSATPAVSDAFKQMISRIHLINGSATLTLNSGDAASIAPYKTIKSSTDTLDFEHTITIL
jgi:hypothetical protein